MVNRERTIRSLGRVIVASLVLLVILTLLLSSGGKDGLAAFRILLACLALVGAAPSAPPLEAVAGPSRAPSARSPPSFA
jgi:hypothetical protein